MTSFPDRLKQIRWYQWLLSALVLIYIAYIGLSYLYLPGKLKQVVETDVAGRIGREIAVERIDFNPFVLSLTVGRFSVADQPGKPLVGWQQLFVNFSLWKSMVNWEIALADVSIDRPEINIEKHWDRFNFSDIIDRFAAADTPEDAPETPPAESPGMVLEVSRTAIHQGVFRFTDLSGSAPARSDLNDISMEVEDLYLATGDEHLNPFDLNAKFPDGGDLQLRGRYRIDPLHMDAEISGSKIQISTFSGFMENILPTKISDGRLSFNTRLLAKLDTGFQLQTDQGHLQITDLALDDAVTDPPMLRAGSIAVDGAALDLQRRQLTVDRVMLDGISAHQWLDEAGALRYEPLIAKASKAAPRPGPSGDTHTPWTVLVKGIHLKDSTLDFSDQHEAITRDHTLSNLALDIENFTLTSGAQMSVQASALLDTQGRIGADGGLVLSPFSINLHYRLEDIPLAPFSEYIETAAFLRIETGDLSVDGTLSMGAEAGAGLKATLDPTLNHLILKDTRTGTSLFSLEALTLTEVQVDTDTRRVTIASLDLATPAVFAEISPEKAMNLAGLSKPGNISPAPPEKLAEPGKGADWAVVIEKIALQDGTAHYTDQSVTPAFRCELQGMALTVARVATDSTEPIPFSLAGKIDRYAPFAVTGTLAPLNHQPGFAFTSTLDGLEMPGLSPYAATFIGNNLKSGKLSLALDYRLENRTLKGKNNIVADNLYLGEKVPSNTAITAPVALGLALMRNLDGVIDLDVGVSGDLDDPGFSVSGIVIKALVNIIVKAAASPFKLLGALVGSAENLGDIEFTQGIGTLGPENEARLKQLSNALTQRPQLALRIKGKASKTDDATAMKAQRVREIVAAARGISPADLGATAEDPAWWTAPDNRDALSALNDALGLPEAAARALTLQTDAPDLQGEALAAAVSRQLYANVTGAQVIEPETLLSLADNRALAIRQYLVAVLGLDPQRVSVSTSRESDLTGRIVTLEIEAM